LPLKSNFRARVKGIIHEVSSSGATLYIEPLDIIEKNNQLVEQENNYRQEVVKILKELTTLVRAHLQSLNLLAGAVSFLDTIYARARFSLRHKCIRAEELQRGIRLNHARHPLLGGKAVPIDLRIENDTQVLIISGPNAGGKTVCLKTAGLFAVMNQFGMEIPAGEGSGLALFDAVYADIGDEQSIEESLSTFSGHMRAIAGILRESTRASLILLDELGAGTDPEEGSALAMAILDFFIRKDCLVLVSTHQGILKNYAFMNSSVHNASVEFDTKTLTPTYKVIPELPGESHALEIAGSNGLEESIVRKARLFLKSGKSDISEMIKNIAAKQKELREREEFLKVRETELKEKFRNLDLKNLQLKQRDYEIKAREQAEGVHFLKESRKTLENLIRNLREGELSRAKIKDAKQFLDTLEEEVESRQDNLQTLEKIIDGELYPAPAAKDLEPGMEVIIRNARRKGKILRKGKGRNWVVATDSLKISIPESELSILKEKDDRMPLTVSFPELSSLSKPEIELDVRGQRLEEALACLEKQIDRALLAGLWEFSVIHGKGEGILQEGIHEYLRNSPCVIDFFFSSPNQGGFGKTIVKLVKK
ncbi:MAG: Smr/MutS family protein, partial [Spirochaetota bacterium]